MEDGERHTHAVLQEQQARGARAHLPHAVWVLGLPSRHGSHRARRERRFTCREKAAQDWLPESGGPHGQQGRPGAEAPTGSRTPPVPQLQQPWGQALQRGRPGATRQRTLRQNKEHATPRPGRDPPKETWPRAGCERALSFGGEGSWGGLQVTLRRPCKDGVRSCAWLPFST